MLYPLGHVLPGKKNPICSYEQNCLRFVSSMSSKFEANE